MKNVTTTILHFAHDKFKPFWKYDANRDILNAAPPFDAGTIRSRMMNITKVHVLEGINKPYDTLPSVLPSQDVKVYNLVNELIYYDRTKDFAWYKLSRVKFSCEQKKQIVICIHGIKGDTDYGHIYKHHHGNENNSRIKYTVLAEFIYELVKDKSDSINILLSMCYGARSIDPKKNHGSFNNLSHDDLKSSFAYKFGNALAKKLYESNPERGILRLTARTGLLAFQYETGASLVESEESILNTLALRELNEEIREIEKHNSSGRSISDMIDLQKEKSKILRILKKDPTSTLPSRKKYGKFIYEYMQGDSCKITMKYTDNGPQEKIISAQNF